MNRTVTSNVTIKERNLKGAFIKTTAVLVVVASASGITYASSPALKNEEISVKQKNATGFEIKRQNIFSPVKPKHPRPKLLKSADMSGAMHLGTLHTNQNEGYNFEYADDFDTVDDSDNGESVYVSVSYGGTLHTNQNEGYNFEYADDFDTVDDSERMENVSIPTTSEGQLFVRRDRG